jgi:hypothetical protein
MGVRNGRYLITNLQSEAVSTMPLSGRADAGELPDVTETTHAMLADQPALDEFVALCLAQLRQVMDGLQ